MSTTLGRLHLAGKLRREVPERIQNVANWTFVIPKRDKNAMRGGNN
jgi:hypothetical protein